MGIETPTESRWRNALRPLCDEAPEGYLGRYEEFAAARGVFYQELAVALWRPLEAHLRDQPQDTVAEKAALAQQLSKELSRLGLAIRCQRTGRPAVLIAHTTEDDPSGKGYFGLDVTDGAGNAVRTLSKIRKLPVLELMENDPSRAPPLSRHIRRGSNDPKTR